MQAREGPYNILILLIKIRASQTWIGAPGSKCLKAGRIRPEPEMLAGSGRARQSARASRTAATTVSAVG